MTDSKDEKPREKLQGWIPPLATPQEILLALEKAFDYRGDVTLTLKSGQVIEGYIFDRHCEGTALDRCFVRIYPKDSNEKAVVPYSDIARMEFSGRDTAEGRGFEAWIRKYRQKKAQGDKNISLEPEPLD